MGHFITIGKHTLNLDLVAKIEDEQDAVIVTLAVPTANNPGYRTERYTGEDADLLRWWVQQHALNLATAKQSSGQEIVDSYLQKSK